MKKKKHILWIPSWYPSEVYPFLGNFIQRWSIADSVFAKVSVLVLVEGKHKWNVIAHAINKDLTEIRIYIPASRNRSARLMRQIWAGFKGYRFIKNKLGKTDILHLCVLYPAGILAFMLSFMYQTPLVISEHWTGYKKEDGNFHGLFRIAMTKLIFWRASAIIALNPSMIKTLQQHGLYGNFHLIPNVVNTDDLPLQKFSLPTGLFKFIHVSGLDNRQKNISGILHAIQNLVKKRQDFQVDFVGGEDQVSYFKAMAHSMGISPFAVFQGAKPNESVLQKMAESDAFILFSNFENLPCVILEAMAIGLPVIATETGSMHEWIDESTGILLERGDIAGLVRAMDFMIDHYDDFDSEKSKRLIRERCSPVVVGKAFSEIYAAVISSKN